MNLVFKNNFITTIDNKQIGIHITISEYLSNTLVSHLANSFCRHKTNFYSISKQCFQMSSPVLLYWQWCRDTMRNARRSFFFSLDMRITYDGRIIKQNVSLQQECLAIPTVSLSIIKPKFSIFFFIFKPI